MFHHFHDNKTYKKNYSSLNKTDLLKIINYIGKKNINSPNEFVRKVNKKKLNSNDLCLTFDDALKSQIKIALPILEKLNIKAFFFIYTDIYNNKKNLMEPIRDFIQTKFKNFNKFYKFFFQNLNSNYDSSKVSTFIKKKNSKMNKMKSMYNFYSINEIKYRIIRDYFFKNSDFHFFMMSLFKKKKYNLSKRYDEIFMTKKDINSLIKKGHFIGLHSHTHPHKISRLNFSKQKMEYNKNFESLKNINKNLKIISMSHPTGSYNKSTFKILKKLKVKIGFNSSISTLNNTKKVINPTNFEIAREDCKNILNLLRFKLA